MSAGLQNENIYRNGYFDCYAPNIISIGSICMTRYQIERYLNLHHNGFRCITFFFDWLYLGGVRGVKYMLDHKFKLFASEFSPYYVINQDLFIARHQPSGFGFLHEFGGARECV